jgi:hypothetical protein
LLLAGLRFCIRTTRSSAWRHGERGVDDVDR